MKTRAPSRTRTTLVNLVFSYASLALLFVHGLVLTPLYLSVIPVGLYGAWLAFGAIFAALELVDPGMGQIVQQRTAHALGCGDDRRLIEAVGTGAVVACLLAAGLLLVMPFAAFAPAMVSYSGTQSGDLVLAFTIGVIARAVGVASAGITAAGMGLQLARWVGSVHLMGGVLSIGVTVVMLLRGAGLASLPTGLLARGIFVCVLNAAGVTSWTKKHLGAFPRVTWRETRAQFGITGFTFAARAASSVLGRLDTLLAAWFFGPEQAAVLGITGRAAELVRAIAERPAQAAAAGLSHMVGERSPRTGQTMSRLLLVSSALAAIGMGSVVAANEIFVGAWVGSHLYGGTALTIMLVLAGGVGVISSAAHQMLVAVGAIKQSAVLLVREAGLRLPLQVLLPAVFGIAGIPVAYAIAGLIALMAWVPSVLGRQSTNGGAEVRGWFAASLGRFATAVGSGVVIGAAMRWLIGDEASWRMVGWVGGMSALCQVALCVSSTDAREVFLQMISARRARETVPSVGKSLE